MSTEELMDEIVNEADYDWIDLSHAIALVAMEEKDLDDLELLRRAGRLVAQLLRDLRLVAGNIGSGLGRFVPARMTSEEAARMVEHEVEQVASGRKPYVPVDPFMFADAESSSIDWDADHD